MPANELRGKVSAYRTGLDAEIMILRQLESLASAQQESGARNDVGELTRIGDQREGLMQEIAAIERSLKPIRDALAANRRQAAAVPEFEAIVERHRTAGELVSRILTSDEQTMKSLRDAEVARRLAAQTLELGEATLSAYRRVVSPHLGGPAVVDRRG